MKKIPVLIFAGLLSLSLAAEAGAAQKGIKSMSRDQLITLAMSAAPWHIAKDATVMIPGADGKLAEARKGTNGFTCIPDIDGQDVPDPICTDEAATQFLMDMMNKKEKPTNGAPGVAYMAKGGWHWEKNGKIIMNTGEAGAKRVKEPPHWMILWPFDPARTGLRTVPGKFGTYIMFENTPYAHLMIYQDPGKLK